MATGRHRLASARAFLTRLARDTRGNTLAIMAAAVIPLAGMVGGGVDLSRMYIVKTRLQHACDAGALAGRKTMGGGTWDQSSYAPRTEAQRFFDANYNSAAYGATNVTRTFTEAGGKVTGNASATVPMTLMRIFGRTTETLSVICDAEMRLPNTDVMFVLDTTKSMVCAPSATTMFCSDAGANSRMAGLRVAVKCFYQIVARLDITDTDCVGSEPSGGTGDEVQIRFGFVPYATNVNVGKLLPNAYLRDTAPYQTRQRNMTPPGTTTNGPYWEYYDDSISSSNCFKYMKNEAFTGFSPTPLNSGGPNPTATVVTSFPHDGSVTSGGSDGEWSYSGAGDTSGDYRSCRRRRTDVTTTYVPTFASWNYGQFSLNVAGFKASGSSWNNSITLPIGNNGTDKTISWEGCIEERDTTVTTDFDPIPAAAYDLNIDLVPNSDATRWRPALPDVIYTRSATSGSGSGSGWSTAAVNNTTTNYNNGSTYSCPSEARKLQEWPTASVFDDYVDGLIPDGATYHDIGLLWGARLMSATGLFASENAYTPDGGEIERHLIFMTDGDTNANDYDYAAYGLPWFDRRQTGSASAPTKAQLDEQVNLRFVALCNAVKAKNITLWVISFGASVNETNQDRLEACATSGRFFTAADSTALQNTFRSIADQISQLRLTQ